MKPNHSMAFEAIRLSNSISYEKMLRSNRTPIKIGSQLSRNDYLPFFSAEIDLAVAEHAFEKG